MKRLLSLLLLLCLPVTVQAVTEVVGGKVQVIPITKGVTTDTTQATAVAVPSGPKTFFGQVVCTSGACVQTQAIYGSATRAAENGVLLCTITLTDTTQDQDACPVITANFPFYYVTTTSTSGTAATGAVYAMY